MDFKIISTPAKLNHMKIIFLLLAVTFCNVCLAKEIQETDSIPKGWQTSPNNDPDVEIGTDTLIKHSGKASAFIYRSPSGNGGTGGLTQVIEAIPYLGKRIRLSVYAKSKDVQRAFFYMRVDGKETSPNFANTMKNSIEETTEWGIYQITLDVPDESVNIVFGSVMINRGTLWIDDYKLEIVDKTMPSDNILTEQQKTLKFAPRNYLPNKIAINLGFEER